MSLRAAPLLYAATMGLGIRIILATKIFRALPLGYPQLLPHFKFVNWMQLSSDYRRVLML